MSRIPDPVRDHVEERLLRILASRPDMLADWLERLGANRVRPIKGGFHSTCPIHQGDNPNGFALWYEREGVPLWKCYTDCAAGGPITTLLMRKFDVSRATAVRWMAVRAGVPIDGETLPREIVEQETLQAWKHRMGIGGSGQAGPNLFPEWMVEQSRRQQHPLLLDRGFSQAMIDLFEIGFVSGGTWVRRSPDGNRMEGWFEDRVSFPYRDLEGRLIGFAGRRVDGREDRKYQTLPGTDRRFALYGLHLPQTQQAIRERRKLVIVEGYTDVMRAHQFDCPNVGAVSGTGFSVEQARIVKRFPIDEVVVAMDPDGPGREAAHKIVEQLQSSFRMRMASFPPDVDPGDVQDAQVFWASLISAQPAFEIKGAGR